MSAALIAMLVVATPAAAGPATNIAGGSYASQDAWPWVTALRGTSGSGGDFERTFCTGTLIAPDRVLTAAHCVDGGMTAAEVQVLVGRKNLHNSGEGERHAVRAIVLHPQAYLPVTGVYTNQAYYDVAVLFLATSSAITPAPLGDERAWADPAKGWVMGWGHVNYDHTVANRVFDPRLKAAELDLLNDYQCRAAIDTQAVQYYYPTIHLCAYDYDRVDCITHGDSGGPLMVWFESAWRLIGVTSFYPPTVESCSVTGFAWVAGPTLRDWILTVPPPDPVKPPEPVTPAPTVYPITVKLARGYVRTIIGQRTSGRVRGRSISCVKLSVAAARCQVGWRIGRKKFRGRARVFHYLSGATTYWSYRFNGRSIKTGCRRQCVKRISW